MTKQEIKESAIKIKKNLASLKRTQSSLAGVFKCTPQQIYQAINTDLQPTLRDKILTHIEMLNLKKNQRS
uniref:Uncharacterized protein n=1 Tax=viral metagenome TaxID=1070528 RepID=A0A6H1ZSH0_9ZZZZ